jgi:hypothetical protein
MVDSNLYTYYHVIGAEGFFLIYHLMPSLRPAQIASP